MKRIVVFSLAVLIGLTVAYAFAAGGGGYKVGDAVFAEWVTNGWYHGKIAKTCDAGWHIAFDDGDQKCCSLTQIVKDAVPAANKVKVGKKVLAQWSNGRYYPGRVTAIAGGSYTIKFDDGDQGAVTLNQIRLR